MDRLSRRFLLRDPDSLTETELLELLLRFSTTPEEAHALAARLLAQFSNLAALLEAQPELLAAVDGMKEDDVLLLRLVPVLSGGSPIAVLTPSQLQLEQIRTKWERHVPRASVFYASPYGDPAALDRVCARLREAEGSLVVLDCIGYTQAMKRRIAAATGKKIILARTLLARVVDELLDT